MRKFKAAAKILQGLAVIAGILLLVAGGAYAAEMQDYCLIPPYVKTDVSPNIKIIMDNSKVMGGPVYTWTTEDAITDANVRAFPQCTDVSDPMYSRMALRYDPTREYLGMFKTNIWYSYAQNRFEPDSSGVFDGNLLNFLTTSQYDLMMAILVGGKSTSRQTNVNTLMAYNASVHGTCSDGTTIVSWDVRVFEYIGTDGQTYYCEFTVNDNNRGDLTVSDSIFYHSVNSSYVCGLIKSPGAVRPGTGYFWPQKADASDFIDMPRYAQKQSGDIPGDSLVKHIFSFINGVFELFAQPAEAAALKIVNPGNNATFNTTLHQAMTNYQCTGSGGSEAGYTWSATGLPSGITISAAGQISGTPRDDADIARGNIAVVITLRDSAGTTKTQNVKFTVSGTALSITAPTTTMNDAVRYSVYSYQCTANGGAGAGSYSWSAIGLPAGLSIAAGGLISGTPTAAAGTYNVTVRVNDGYHNNNPSAPVTSTVTLTIRTVGLSITSPASGTDLPSSQFGVAYAGFTAQAAGGTGTYTWSAVGLPAGLTINAATGSISGTPTQYGTFAVTITVADWFGGVQQSTASRNTNITIYGLRITWPSCDNFNIGDSIRNTNYAARFRFVAQGSAGVYDWDWGAAPSPDVTIGFVIDDPGDNMGRLRGMPTYGSDAYFTRSVTVTDGVTSDTIPINGYVWTAGTQIQIINLSNNDYLPPAYTGQPYTGYGAGTFYGSGVNNWTITGLPAGMNYFGQSGLIYGTPSAGTGCYTVNMSVTSGTATASSRSVYLCVNYPDIIMPSRWCPSNPSYLPTATVNTPWGQTFGGSGGTAPYTWSATGMPSGLSMDASTGYLSGAPTVSGFYTISVTITDNAGLAMTARYYLSVGGVATGPSITDPLNNTALTGASEGYSYAYNCAATGGTGHYTWTTTGLPAGLSIDSTGLISGTPAAGTAGAHGTTYNVTITVTDSAARSNSVAVTLTVTKSTFTPNTATFNIHICAGNYDLNCDSSNAELDCDTSQAVKDNCQAVGWCNPDNGNACELKSGILQTYWEQARFGLVDFDNSADPSVDKCIPASPQSSFFTAVENALPIDDVSKLINAEYMGVHAYMGDLSGSNSCDPFDGDDKTCRKNFILMLSNGEGALNPPTPGGGSPTLFGTLPATGTLPAACSALTYALSKNACYGYQTDLRSATVGENAITGKQYVSTYTVNAMGTNGAVLQEAAENAGGIYYYSADANELKDKIEQALKDIIKRAAAGTAASVLASGEGSGANLIQAIFYPRSPTLAKGGIFSDEISWIGRLSNYWYYVDPFFGASSIREDTDSDFKLNIRNDYTATFYYDTAAEQTKAELLEDTNSDGFGDACRFGPRPGNTYSPACGAPSKVFEKLNNLWEAGVELWKRTSARTIKTWVDSDSDGVVAAGEFLDFSTGNAGAIGDAGTLSSYLALTSTLDATPGVDDDDAEVLIRYVHGEDFIVSDPKLRTRTVKVDLNNDGDVADTDETVPRVWKLGDVLNSTPKIASHLQLHTYNESYGDTTYKDYLNSSVYQNKGAVFAGGNDGMLHAFKLGKLELRNSATCTLGTGDKACLTGTDKGKELWAYIPKNVLPYLKYLADPAYCHVFSVDMTPYVFDASIKIDADTNDADSGGDQPAECTAGEYWRCIKTKDSWRTIIIGGMRFGGASRSTSCTGLDCVTIPDTVNNNGYSSYFALDVTDENSPQLLWEFSHPQLGFTTTGPTIVRIDARKPDPFDNTKSIKDEVPGSTKNGRWFVVLGSGPTGPITDDNTQQFLGRSDQDLRLFVLDLKTGQIIRTIETGLQNAFAGSMINATHNVDAPDYQDDVVYVPYVRKCGLSDALHPCTLNTWTDGGVLRLLTREDLNGNNLSGTVGVGTTALNPGNWVLSTVTDGIGPVTSSVQRLQHQTKKKLWLYFATGRYFYETQAETDDGTRKRHLFGMQDPCFVAGEFTAACTDNSTLNDPVRTLSDLGAVDLTVAEGTTDADGWSIELDDCTTYAGTVSGCDSAYYGTERVITDPLATTAGLVFFTSYKPYRDECALGGKSQIWALKYDTGAAPGALLKGKAIVQVSTGAIEQIDLSTAFTEKTGRRSGSLEGVPPTAQGLSIISSPPPVKRVLHIRER